VLNIVTWIVVIINCIQFTVASNDSSFIINNFHMASSTSYASGINKSLLVRLVNYTANGYKNYIVIYKYLK